MPAPSVAMPASLRSRAEAALTLKKHPLKLSNLGVAATACRWRGETVKDLPADGPPCIGRGYRGGVVGTARDTEIGATEEPAQGPDAIACATPERHAVDALVLRDS